MDGQGRPYTDRRIEDISFGLSCPTFRSVHAGDTAKCVLLMRHPMGRSHVAAEDRVS